MAEQDENDECGRAARENRDLSLSSSRRAKRKAYKFRSQHSITTVRVPMRAKTTEEMRSQFLDEFRRQLRRSIFEIDRLEYLQENLMPVRIELGEEGTLIRFLVDLVELAPKEVEESSEI